MSIVIALAAVALTSCAHHAEFGLVIAEPIRPGDPITGDYYVFPDARVNAITLPMGMHSGLNLKPGDYITDAGPGNGEFFVRVQNPWTDGPVEPMPTTNVTNGDLMLRLLSAATNSAVIIGSLTPVYDLPVLNGQPANIRMWGAKGDGVTDDTAAIQRAIHDCLGGVSSELIIPRAQADYILSDTLIVGVGLHIRGESLSQSRLRMTVDKDVIRTYEANYALTNAPTFYFDEDFILENLTINMPMSATNCFAVTLKPGEASVIRNLHINGGGRGIRCLGMGAPGLRCEYCTISDSYHAGIYVQGFLGTNWLGGGGPMMLLGLSGDHRRTDSDATVSLVYLDHCYGPVQIEGLKCEGHFGGGIIRYDYSWDADTNADAALASVSLKNCTANVQGSDFVVLGSDAQRVPSVSIEQINATGVRNMIVDSLTGRTVAPDWSAWTQARLPVYYEAMQTPDGPRTRLISGGSALVTWLPVSSGWYRVLFAGQGYTRLTGKLRVSSREESTEFVYDVAPGVANLSRTGSARSWATEPHVTAARVGYYASPGLQQHGAFLDLYVESLPMVELPLILALPLEGQHLTNPHYGSVPLQVPVTVGDLLCPTNCTLLASNGISL